MNETDLSFDSVTVKCINAKALLHELDETNELWGVEPWIFRGQNDARWELMPSLYRDEERTDITFRELALVSRFVRLANQIDMPLPADTTGYFHYYDEPKSITQTGVDDVFGDRLLYDFRHAAFAIAQHSGVPTRLLDFTRDPFVAAYFAAEGTGLGRKLGASAEDRARYLDETFWKWNNGEDPRAILQEYWSAAQNVAAKFPREVAVWALRVDSMQLATSLRMIDHPYAEILNLRAQQGVFVCDINRYDIAGEPVRSFDKELEKLVQGKGIYKFVLPASELDELRFFLSKKGYFAASMRPTYELVGRMAVENIEQEIEARLQELDAVQ